ncbi:hypothetical protein SAMN05216207_102427 [Pseudonocardia ammonioxydans]|uniref:STAS domain-containing protein n=2 Tax=Pseudonocardia ammonioxydans TaxID=260086 RepID=A0A1I5CUU1_PSUAM|nr:hypothetical protein SAMN05216207_102427 [Pseudonocardia ammonioxydans]
MMPSHAGSPSPGPARLTIETPAPGVRLLGVNGVLDSGAGARLLRLIDSQLLLARGGHKRVVGVIVDVSQLEALERGGSQAIEHARYACTRRNIEFAIAGHPSGLTAASVSARTRLGQVRSFPTVDAALRSVARDSVADRHEAAAHLGTN